MSLYFLRGDILHTFQMWSLSPSASFLQPIQYIHCKDKKSETNKSPCTPKVLSQQVLGVKIRTLFMHMWHIHIASDPTWRSGNTTHWFRTCANILLCAHRARRDLRGANCDACGVHFVKVTVVYIFCYIISYSTIAHIKYKTEVIS